MDAIRCVEIYRDRRFFIQCVLQFFRKDDVLIIWIINEVNCSGGKRLFAKDIVILVESGLCA